MSLLGGVCCFRYFQKKHTTTIVVLNPFIGNGTGSVSVLLKCTQIKIFKEQFIKIVISLDGDLISRDEYYGEKRIFKNVIAEFLRHEIFRFVTFFTFDNVKIENFIIVKYCRIVQPGFNYLVLKSNYYI